MLAPSGIGAAKRRVFRDKGGPNGRQSFGNDLRTDCYDPPSRPDPRPQSDRAPGLLRADAANTSMTVCEQDIEQSASRAIPLLIDLEHALLRTAPVAEAALAYIAANPLRIAYPLAGWAWQGRAYLEKNLLEVAEPDPNLIPVNEEVNALADAAKRDGRQVFLVSDKNEFVARSLCLRIPHFTGVIFCDGAKTGSPKATAIMERFPGGYDYVGGGATDPEIWRNARAALVMAPSKAFLQSIAVRNGPTTGIPRRSRLSALIKASRLHQLAKNALIFVPAVLSGTIVDLTALINCVLAFLALGLVAIGTYLINDMIDLAHDRRHWSKRFRPIASGDLPIGSALAAALVSIAGGMAIASIVGPGVLGGIGAYLVLTIAYSMYLKSVPILDVTVLATLFTLRLAIGIAAAGVVASPWLLVFSMALFTSLSIAKRNTEIQRTAVNGETDVAGRGYVTADAPLVLGLGLATGTASVVILVLFLIFDALERDIYANPLWLWLFPIIIFLWLGRIWLVSQRGELDDDPVAFAIKDRQSLALGAVMAAAFVLAWLGVQL